MPYESVKSNLSFLSMTLNIEQKIFENIVKVRERERGRGRRERERERRGREEGERCLIAN